MYLQQNQQVDGPQIAPDACCEGTPVFKTGLDLTQLPTQTRVAGTSCSRGAAYGANTLKAENSPAFQCLTTG